MAYGFQSISSGDFVQIDDSYSNFKVVSSGTGTAGYWIAFPAQAHIPLIMIRMTSTNGTIFGALGDPSNIELARFNISSNGSNTFSYVILAPQNGAVSADPYGLRILDSTSTCVFDSGLLYMELDDVHLISCTSSAPASVVVSYPACPRGVRYVDLNSTATHYVYFTGSYNGVGWVAQRRFPLIAFQGTDTVRHWYGSNTFYYNGAYNYYEMFLGSVRPHISGYF